MTEACPIRFIPFQTFATYGCFPRYPECKDLVVNIEEIPRQTSLICFISHRWLRGDARPAHPDTPQNDKYMLCITGIQQIWKALAPGMTECFIWLDFGCIDQNQNPAGELKQLDQIIKISDCLFTPVYDANHQSWDYPSGYYTNFDVCGSKGWKDKDVEGNPNPDGYVSRGWCRMEMFYAANIPLYPDNEERKQKFVGGLLFHRERSRRSQFLYSSKEYHNHVAPILLAPLANSYFNEFHPCKGYVTVESDCEIIRRLIDDLVPFMKPAEDRYDGERRDGQPHGIGVYFYANGDEYEGEWINGKKHGKGKITFSSGSTYEGDWVNDKSEGEGVFAFANGDRYEGQFKNDNFNGLGRFLYADGQEFREYRGGFLDDCFHGIGRLLYSNGDVYEGEWIEDNIDGYGNFLFISGREYHGYFKDGKYHGWGRLKEVNGDVYEGEWEKGLRHGKGKTLFADGHLLEGIWENDEISHR